ncbi:MAG: hypothetical protein ROY99_03985 [Ignavibacterium sp.]|jgi:tetratricopeptide (TPR) repeat protein|nr:hypothetical protein [Ignavibacterium sp.]
MKSLPEFKDFAHSDPVLQKRLVKYYNYAGVKQADEGKLMEALNFFNKALRIDPSSRQALFNRATIKVDLGEFEEARKDFSLIINLDATDNQNNLVLSL